VNVSYNFTPKSLFRIAYGITLNRPEFREKANFTFFDADLYYGFTGNPELKTASIHNFDLRQEFYPSENELITIGAFAKYFTNSIEQRIRNSGSGVQFTYGNAEKAISVGAELEIRKSLTNLSDVKMIQDLSLVLNSSVIYSRVYLDEEAFAGQDLKRPMQGQSPFLINAGLNYNNAEIGLQVNAQYNVIGKRIWVVGDKESLPTVYEMPRNVIDFTFTKSLGRHFELKGGVQDILNQKVRLKQDTDRNSKIDGSDDSYQSFKRGTYSTLGINYKF
jgi:outer membrane receptor protein involved in Fe transport